MYTSDSKNQTVDNEAGIPFAMGRTTEQKSNIASDSKSFAQVNILELDVSSYNNLSV